MRAATLAIVLGWLAGCGGAGDAPEATGPAATGGAPEGDPGRPALPAGWTALRATIAAALAARADAEDPTGGDTRVRAAVADLEADLRADPAAGAGLAQALLDEPEPAVRDRLAAALAELHARGVLAGDAIRAPLRRAAADRARPTDVRCAALRAAGPGSGPEPDPALPLLDDPDPRLRRTAVEVLAPRLPTTDRIRARVEDCATRDADPAVRVAALDALVAAVPDARTFTLCAARLIADDGVDAVAAAEGLARLAIPDGGVARLGGIVARVADPAVRTLLLHAIVAGPAAEARALLLRIAADDPDPDVRAVAAELAR